MNNLQKKIIELSNIQNHSDEQWHELDRLSDIRRSDIYSAIPKLSCCDGAIKYNPISVVYNYETEEIYWNLNITYDKTLRSLSEDDLRNGFPKPKFCPYCGKDLQKIIKKDNIPDDLQTIIDGGYYCNTCKERLDNCYCLPAEAAYEIKYV